MTAYGGCCLAISTLRYSSRTRASHARSSDGESALLLVIALALLFARAALAFQPRVRFALRRAVPAMGWADPNWNWGSAIGEAHDLAQPLRARLNADAAAREAWIKRLAAGEVDLEEAKLALGLRAQKARRQRVDGDGLGWRLMERCSLAAVAASSTPCCPSIVQARAPWAATQSGGAPVCTPPPR